MLCRAFLEAEESADRTAVSTLEICSAAGLAESEGLCQVGVSVEVRARAEANLREDKVGVMILDDKIFATADKVGKALEVKPVVNVEWEFGCFG